MSDQGINNRYTLANDIVRQTERLNRQADRKVPDKPGQAIQGETFHEILSRRLAEEVSFSRHADLRVRERDIEISRADLTKLSDACDRAKAKGIRNALIVMNDSAFIVNAGSKTVVTVVDKNEMKSNVFSNIEGAVFV